MNRRDFLGGIFGAFGILGSGLTSSLAKNGDYFDLPDQNMELIRNDIIRILSVYDFEINDKLTRMRIKRDLTDYFASQDLLDRI